VLRLKVEAIQWELPDTATFFFSELSGKKIRYKAGQFITLVFNHHDEEIRRCYSLSSSPDEPLLSITVKRIPNGEISRFLLTKVKQGDILHAVEPTGRFILTGFEAKKDLLFFTAGSGIVPVYSQLKYVLNQPGGSKLTLIYSNRDEKSVIFKQQLDRLASEHTGRLRIVHLLSNEGKRLNNLAVEQLVRRSMQYDQAKAEFYLCGPFTYMRMIRLTLLYMGFENGQVRKENFVLQTVPVTAGLINFPPRKMRIHFKGELYDLVAGENQSILQAALQNNIQLPYSCRVGECSTCAAMCKKGRVAMIKNDVLTDADIAAGWILTCTGHALTDDVVIAYQDNAPANQ